MTVLNSTTSVVLLSTDDVAILPPGRSIIVTDTRAVLGPRLGPAGLMNFGDIVAGNRDAILIQTIGAFTFQNGSTGVVASIQDAFIALGDFGNVVTLTNDGQIIGGRTGVFYTVSIEADVSRLSNSGLISGGQFGILSDRPGQYFNSGQIVGGVCALQLSQGGVTVENSGRIEGGEVGLDLTGITAATIYNSGSINGEIGIQASDAASVIVIENTGAISGTTDAVLLTEGANTLRNFGQIFGDVTMLGGDDQVHNSGVVTGDVDLGNGDDTYNGTGGGRVSGLIRGGAGDDTFVIDAPGQSIDGGAGTNDRVVTSASLGVLRNVEQVIMVGSGDIEVTGSDAADRMRGNIGANVIDGAAGNDTIRAGHGDDTLLGGAGDDVLFGEAGQDMIIGGAGKDLMNGGLDADVFVFEDVGDSGTTGATADIITGFQHGVDKIDLSFLSNASLVGTGAFTGGGEAEIRVQLLTKGNSRLLVDADGNGTTDMMITLLGQQTFDAGDFIL